MICSIEAEKQCSQCRQCKPVTMFSRLKQNDGCHRWHSHCKACRNDRAKLRNAKGLRKDNPKPGKMGETNPGAWKWPRDERPVHDKALDRVLSNWRYSVESGAPAWRIAA